MVKRTLWNSNFWSTVFMCMWTFIMDLMNIFPARCVGWFFCGALQRTVICPYLHPGCFPSSARGSSFTLPFHPAIFFLDCLIWHPLGWEGGGCSSAGRAGRLAIGTSLVQILAPLGWDELHVKVSLSKILNPKLLLRALRWAGDFTFARRQLGLAPATNPATPWKRDKAVADDDTWHDITFFSRISLDC